MHRVFILNDVILNTNFAPRIEKLLACGAWEMPERDVQAVFGDKAGMACNAYCTFTKTDNGYAVTFTPPKVDMEEVKKEKLREAERLLNAKLAELSNYPQAESASFDVQEKEATAYLANTEINKAEIPVITGISVGAQVELAVLAEKIVQNAKDFAPLRGLYLGRHKRVRDLLNKATTLAEVEAVDVAAEYAKPVTISFPDITPARNLK